MPPALDNESKKEVLAEAISRCREKEMTELFDEIQEILREKGIHPTVDLIQDILSL